MWILYQVLYGLALVLTAPFLLLRRGAHYVPTVPGRLTFQGGVEAGETGDPLWVHAVSVGEAGVAATLTAGLAEASVADLPLLVTTITPTGQERARKLFAGRARVAYLPFDLAPLVARFFRRHRPRALVLVEGDFWPAVLRRAGRGGLPVAVVNGRVGDRSFGRLARLRRLPGGRHLLRLFFAPVAAFGMQSDADRRRLTELGVDAAKVRVTGNLKYETPEPTPLPELARHLDGLARGRAVIVAGSTMEGEEEAVLAAYRTADASASRGALLVLAPRHPERWDEVARRVEATGLRLTRRSHLDGGAANAAACQVLLLDTLGELAAVYRHADAAFIGGTLVPTGGHNPLEAARFGVPTAVGPSMENFRDMAAAFDRRQAWARVADGGELGRVWAAWLAGAGGGAATGERARLLVEENRGALGRTVDLLAPLLAEAGLPLRPANPGATVTASDGTAHEGTNRGGA